MAKDNKPEKIVGEAPAKSESAEQPATAQTQAKEENCEQQPESTPEQTGGEKQPPSPATAFANTPEEIADRKTAAAAARKEEKKENRTERESG
uniref:hypothetical protein n=1 Tax=Alistipes communis TaxID=2585118 RepID=UPI003AF9E1BB